MPWTVEWSKTQEAKVHKANGNAHVFEAKTQEEAVQFAEDQINIGRIIWCIRGEDGAIAMDRPAVWDHVHSPQRRRSKAEAAKEQAKAQPVPEAGKASPFERVKRLFRKR